MKVDLTGVAVLSVDLFDTLLLRSVPEPTDVFPLVASRALESGHLRPHLTPGQFASVRRAAEAEARRAARTARGKSEVTLREVYDAMPADWFVTGAPAMTLVELEVECEVTYPNPAVHALVLDARARGLTTVVTSDTLFSAAELARLLERSGISPVLFDRILTSSEQGCSKHEGALFQRLLSHFPGLPPASILHLGDHPHADVRQATRAGLTGVHYDNGQVALRSVRQVEVQRHGNVLPALHPLRALSSTMGAPDDPQLAWWFALGSSVLGPAFAAFADWVVDECVRDGIRTIRPLMREGALFAELIGRSAAAHSAAVDVAPLYASRSATWLASLETFDAGAVAILLQRQHVSIGEALASLSLDATGSLEPLAPHLDLRLGDAARTGVSGSTVAALLTTLVLRPDVRRRIEARIAGERALLNEYLNGACGNAADVALVDLGFRGSTGLAIQAAGRTASSRRYHHLLAFGADKVADAWLRGADTRVFGAGPALNADLAGAIARHPAPLEALLIAGGTTLGYARAEHDVEPHLASDSTPPEQTAAVDACRAGVLAFQARWLEWMTHQPHRARGVASDRRGLVAPIHRLLTLPTALEAARLGAFVHEDNDGGHSIRRLCDPTAVPDEVTPASFLQATLSGGPAFGSSWLWPTGTCEQRWPGYLESLWADAVGASDGAAPAVPALASRMRRDGVSACVVWGAGEAGVALVRTLRREGLDVLCVTDSNPSLWGTQVETVPVVSPAEARQRGNDVFAIGSFAFAPEIERSLRGQYRDAADRVRIFSLASEEAA